MIEQGLQEAIHFLLSSTPEIAVKVGITRLKCDHIVILEHGEYKFNRNLISDLVSTEVISLPTEQNQISRIITDRMNHETKQIYINLTNNHASPELFNLYLCFLSYINNSNFAFPYVVVKEKIIIVPIHPLLEPIETSVEFLIALKGAGGNVNSFSDLTELVDDVETNVKGIAKTSYFIRKLAKQKYVDVQKHGRKMKVKLTPLGGYITEMWRNRKLNE